MTVQFSLGSNAPESTATPVAVVGVYENGVLTSAAARIDTAGGGAIKRLVEAGGITGKVGDLVSPLPPAGGAPLPARAPGAPAPRGPSAGDGSRQLAARGRGPRPRCRLAPARRRPDHGP